MRKKTRICLYIINFCFSLLSLSLSLSLFPCSSLINSRGIVDELVLEEELAAREAGYGATSSVPKVRAILEIIIVIEPKNQLSVYTGNLIFSQPPTNSNY